MKLLGATATDATATTATVLLLLRILKSRLLHLVESAKRVGASAD